MVTAEKSKQNFEISFQRWSANSGKYEVGKKPPTPDQEGVIAFGGLEIEISPSGRHIFVRKTDDEGGAAIAEKFQGQPERTLQVGEDILPNKEERERRDELLRDWLGPDQLALIPPEDLEWSDLDTFTFSVDQNLDEVLEIKTEWSAVKRPEFKSGLEYLQIYESKPKSKDDHPDKLVITNIKPGIREGSGELG